MFALDRQAFSSCQLLFFGTNQYTIDMKKFLEVLMDDEGLLHLSTDFEFADSRDNPPSDITAHMAELDDLHKRAIRSLVNEVWKNRNQHPSKAIRILAMAEIIACAEPYDHAEQFWSTMMFDYIPGYEKLASSLKKPFGYDPSRMIRPVSGVFTGGIPPFPFGFGKTKS